MAVNRYLPHLVVLSEDDKTRSLAVGFSDYAAGPMDIRPPSGGWPSVLHEFVHTYIPHLRKYETSHVLMVIDFDNDFPGRFEHFQNKIPADLSERVFVLGSLDEAETLQKEQKMSVGQLGTRLASECAASHHDHWDCPQLVHNKLEVDRLNAKVKPFLI